MTEEVKRAMEQNKLALAEYASQNGWSDFEKEFPSERVVKPTDDIFETAQACEQDEFYWEREIKKKMKEEDCSEEDLNIPDTVYESDENDSTDEDEDNMIKVLCSHEGFVELYENAS